MPDPTQGLIRVDVAVTDKSGKPVTGLSEKDFTLFDNNEQRKIVTFQAFNGGIQPASSFEVVLVIDELNMLANVRSGKIALLRSRGTTEISAADREVETLLRSRGKTEISAADREVETFLRSQGGVLQHPTIIYRLTEHGLFATPRASMDGNELADEIEHWGRQRRICVAVGDRHRYRQDRKGQRRAPLARCPRIDCYRRAPRPGRKVMFWIGNGWQIEGSRGTGLFDFSIELLTRMREARINLWGSSEWPLYDTSGNAMPVHHHVYKEY